MNQIWNRSEQVYWILRDNTWDVISMKTGKIILSGIPQICDDSYIYDVCFAADQTQLEYTVYKWRKEMAEYQSFASEPNPKVELAKEGIH